MTDISEVVPGKEVAVRRSEACLHRPSSSFSDVLHESSRDADVVFVGMAEPNDDYVSYVEQLRELTGDLPLTVYVPAAEEIAFEDVPLYPL